MPAPGWEVGELGSLLVGSDGEARAVAALGVGAYAVEQEATFITYFDPRVDYELNDRCSQERCGRWSGGNLIAVTPGSCMFD